ncbi:hypothetical protein V5O48_016833 [Marasmius crinis-equi]|uniref:F-box domain-containing protein n=1 Tax=Marasmius crinis-equi TaxID=585013 RepID=A0ABR3EQL5_9AGAR
MDDAVSSPRLSNHMGHDIIVPSLQRTTSTTSPVQRLPNEILDEIFRHTSGQNLLGSVPVCWDPEYLPRSRISMAFRISSVCSRWRSIALSLPAIWANMWILLVGNAEQAVQLCLQRSQQHPLTLKLDVWTDGEGQEIVQEVIRNTWRWKYLDLSRGTPDLVESFDTPHPFPILEAVSIPAYCVDAFFEECVSYTPRLSRLEYFLDDVTDGVDRLYLRHKIPWASIRQLVWSYDFQDTLDSVLTALRQVGIQLVSLGYLITFPFGPGDNGLGLSRPYPKPVAPVTSSDLITSPIRSLSLSLTRVDDSYAPSCNILHDLIRRLTLPSLESLSVASENAVNSPHSTISVPQEMEWPRDALNECIQRSNCTTLTTLTLEGIPLIDSDVLSLLEFVPSVETLTLREFGTLAEFKQINGTFDRPISASHVSRLADPPTTLHKTVTKSLLAQFEVPAVSPSSSDDHIFLPKLEYLELTVQSHFDADKTFITAVESRSRDDRSDGVVSLRRAVLYVRKPRVSADEIEGELLRSIVYGCGKRVD